MTAKVWSETKTGGDGLVYSVRYFHDDDEIIGLQSAGLIGPVAEVIGMQDVADAVIAGLEKQIYTACGGQVQ